MRTFVLLLLAVFALSASPASADEVYTFVVKKQEEKAKSRWSLQSWLETKEKMRLMDMWLAMHSPSPYEFILGGNYQFNEAATRYNAWEVFGVAYASIFGLEARREAFLSNGGDVTRLHGIFDFRIFGYHAQSTNLTLQAGLRQQDEGTATFRNALAGATLTIYLGRFFGVDGLYRKYFNSTPTGLGTRISADRYEGGAFLDFSFLRIFGKYFSEPETRTTLSGVTVGTQIFF